MKEKLKPGKRSRTIKREARRTSRAARLPQAIVNVTFRHLESTPALRLYAERKLGHVARILKRACEVHLILTVDKYRQYGEVTVKSGRVAVAAQEQARDLYSVIDLLSANVERQLKKHLGKIKTRRVRAPSAGEVLSAQERVLPGS